MENLDHLTKTDSGFPTPESNQILAIDGFGLRGEGVALLLPAALLACVLKPVEKRRFYSLSGKNVIAEGIVYQLPDTLTLAYNANRLYQSARSVTNPDKILFEVRYSRDYDQIDCNAREVLRAAGIDFKRMPRQQMNPNDRRLWRYSEEQEWAEYGGTMPPQWMLEDWWRECQFVLKNSNIFQ